MTTIYTKKTKDELPERSERDFYPTEMDLITQALQHVFLGTQEVKRILDIGAGDGRWGLAAKERYPYAFLYGVDLVGKKPEGFTVWDNEDYLETPYRDGLFNLIVSNPPYYLSEKIIRRAWKQLAPGGEMVFLLPLQFLAGVDRMKHLWMEIPLVKVGVLSRRPSFYGRKTNGTDYGVFYWEKNYIGDCAGRSTNISTFFILHQRDSVENKPKVYQQPKLAGVE